MDFSDLDSALIHISLFCSLGFYKNLVLGMLPYLQCIPAHKLLGFSIPLASRRKYEEVQLSVSVEVDGMFSPLRWTGPIYRLSLLVFVYVCHYFTTISSIC